MATLSGFMPKDSIHVTEKIFVQSVAAESIKTQRFKTFPRFRVERLEQGQVRFSILSIALEDIS